MNGYCLVECESVSSGLSQSREVAAVCVGPGGAVRGVRQSRPPQWLVLCRNTTTPQAQESTMSAEVVSLSQNKKYEYLLLIESVIT